MPVLRHVRKGAVTVLGFALLAFGGAMLVLPGPGILVIVAGLAVLATEYYWAATALEKARDRARQAAEIAAANKYTTAVSITSGLGMVVFGVLLVFVDRLPFSGALTGSVVMVSGIVVVVTTWLQWRNAQALKSGGELEL